MFWTVVVLPAVVLERENDRIFRCYKSCLSNGLNYILLKHKEIKWNIITDWWTHSKHYIIIYQKILFLKRIHHRTNTQTVQKLHKRWSFIDLMLHEGRSHLKQDISAHGLPVSYDWLLIFTFTIPAVQLNASETHRTAVNTNHTKDALF